MLFVLVRWKDARPTHRPEGFARNTVPTVRAQLLDALALHGLEDVAANMGQIEDAELMDAPPRHKPVDIASSTMPMDGQLALVR